MWKNFALTTLAGLGLTVFFAQASLATTFYLKQNDDSGDVALSGQFTGEDTDNSLSLTYNELTSFDLSIYGNPVYTLPNFTSFFYALNSSDSISFSGAKTEDINDGIISYIKYDIFVDSDADPTTWFITFGSETTYFTDGQILVGDTFSNQPVRVSPSAIPEGSNILALSLLGILALYQKKRRI